MKLNFRHDYSGGEAARKTLKKLESRAAGPIELPQRRNVRAIRTDAPCIYRQTQILRLLNAQPSIVQLSETITFRGNQSIAARKIHRTRRPVRAPALSYNCGEIVPVPSIPHYSPQCPGSISSGHGIGCWHRAFGNSNFAEHRGDASLVWRRAAQAPSGADSNSIVVRKSHQKILCIDKVIG
jgi:hypothetical protein